MFIGYRLVVSVVSVNHLMDCTILATACWQVILRLSLSGRVPMLMLLAVEGIVMLADAWISLIAVWLIMAAALLSLIPAPAMMVMRWPYSRCRVWISGIPRAAVCSCPLVRSRLNPSRIIVSRLTVGLRTTSNARWKVHGEGWAASNRAWHASTLIVASLLMTPKTKPSASPDCWNVSMSDFMIWISWVSYTKSPSLGRIIMKTGSLVCCLTTRNRPTLGVSPPRHNEEHSSSLHAPPLSAFTVDVTLSTQTSRVAIF